MVSIRDTIRPQQKGFAVNKPDFIFEKGQRVLRHNWTEEEKVYLRCEYRYTKHSFNILAREFGVTSNALRKILSRLGLVKYRKDWSKADLGFLCRNYTELPTVALARKLKRSEGAIRQKALKLKISKGDRVDWFTLNDVYQMLGVSQKWLMRRLRNGYKLVIRQFNPEVSLAKMGGSPYYISRASLRDFIRRYPEELNGRNVDFVMLVDILAGIKV